MSEPLNTADFEAIRQRVIDSGLYADAVNVAEALTKELGKPVPASIIGQNIRYVYNDQRAEARKRTTTASKAAGRRGETDMHEDLKQAESPLDVATRLYMAGKMPAATYNVIASAYGHGGNSADVARTEARATSKAARKTHAAK